MSIGYSNPIQGTFKAMGIFAIDPTSPGGAIPGWMPQALIDVDKTYLEYEQVRYTLKHAWNTVYLAQLRTSGVNKPITSPFRAVMNAGDLLSRDNYSCGGPCQTFQSRPGLFGLRGHFGGTSTSCIPSAYYNSLQINPKIPSATCNVKYVYDSSDYTTYLKQRAVNKNYNDLTYGGNDSSGSQSAIRAIHRY